MRCLVLFVLAIGLAGCSHTETATIATADGRAEINTRAERGHAMVALEGERRRPVDDLRVAPDITVWTDAKTGEPRSAPTSEIRAITFRRDGIGALKGAAIGAAVGATLGLIAGGFDDGGSFLSRPPGAYAVLVGTSGAAIGAIAGLIRSDLHTYRPGTATAQPEPQGETSVLIRRDAR